MPMSVLSLPLSSAFLWRVILSKKEYGPSTKEDQDLLDYLESNRLRALRNSNKTAAKKWQKVIRIFLGQQW